MDIQDTELVVLDFETTGIAPRRDRVIEVGAVIMQHISGNVMQTFSALCLPHPDTKVSKSVSNLTGITTSMLQGQSSTADVIARLIEFIGSRPILAHNAAFDSKFLYEEARRIGKAKPQNIFLCSLKLSRRLMAAESYKLTYLQKLIGYNRSKDHKDHRALDDVLVTVRLWSYLRDVLVNSPSTKGEAYDLSFFSRISSMPKAAVHKLLQGEEDGEQGSSVDDTDEEGYDDATPVDKKRRRDEEITDSSHDPCVSTPFKVDRSSLSRSCRSRSSGATDTSSFTCASSTSTLIVSKISSSCDDHHTKDDDPPQLVDLLCGAAEETKLSAEYDDDSIQALHLSAVGTTLLARTDIDTSFRVCTIIDEDAVNVKVQWKAGGTEEQLYSWIPRHMELFSTALAEMRRQTANRVVTERGKQPAKATKSLFKQTRVPTSLTASDIAGCRNFLDRHRAISKASSLVALTSRLSHSSEIQEQCALSTVSGSARLVQPESSSTAFDDMDINVTSVESENYLNQEIAKVKVSSVAVFSGDASRRIVGTQNKSVLADKHSISNNSSKSSKSYKKAAAPASVSILTYFQKTTAS